ncbi:MAG: thioredoxin family protein [Candidatus Gribaldobacteria bacterium]|nr:thioredoxin family protein [Candidatus Gribaldobacteria bacterium]
MEDKITSIQVLGSGCPSCHKLFELTKQAVKELNLEIDVEYIDDIQKIISMGVMQAPVLAVNSKPVLAGSVPDIQKIKSLLKC